MIREIERKFLVVSDDWRLTCIRQARLRDGLIARVDGRKVRVRIADDRAFLTVKGARTGIARDEFEYPIPLSDAERLLADHCDGNVLSKTRHYVREDDFIFEVDVYDGLLAGITIAEAELEFAEQAFPRPAWLGEEVTGRPEFKKLFLLRQRMSNPV